MSSDWSHIKPLLLKPENPNNRLIPKLTQGFMSNKSTASATEPKTASPTPASTKVNHNTKVEFDSSIFESISFEESSHVRAYSDSGSTVHFFTVYFHSFLDR